MQKVVEFLQKNPVQYLATVGRDGRAKCRPFMFCFEQDGKLWFCTNNTKDVYKDMLANPEVEAFKLLNSEMICIFPYFCPCEIIVREIREIFF